MKKITYERVAELITNHGKIVRGDFPDNVNVKYGSSDVAIGIKALIDAINEQISWKGLTVINKIYICLPSETTPLIRHEFDAKTEFECVSDMDDQITILSNDGTYCSAKKEWFYIKD